MSGTVSGNADARSRLQESVSRETFERLETFVAMLRDWNRCLNLIATSTEDTIWYRHVIDSAQLATIWPIRTGRWLDIGTGGGFPGLVVAILGAELAPDMDCVLLEAHQRKAEFLRRVVLATGVQARIVPERAEAVDPVGADCISARAVAPLGTLLPLVARHLDREGVALLMKGATAEQEGRAARAAWRFRSRSRASMTGNGTILVLSGIMPVMPHA